MNTANREFSPVTPIDHTYQCHVLFPLCMLYLKMGKGRQAIPSASIHTGHYTALQSGLPSARGYTATNGRDGAQGMCSRELVL